MATVRILIAAFAAVVLLGVAEQRASADAAPSPEAVSAASELLAILSPDMRSQLAGQITNAFWPVVEQSARADKIDDATIAELRKEFDRLQLAFLTEAMKEAPTIYARHFSISELKELTAFYRTPTGAKALHEMPQVMGEFTTLVGPRLQDLQRQTMEAFATVLRAHGYAK
jgi:uncharacterized protein